MEDQTFEFLSKIPPFTFLPEEELRRVVFEVSMKRYPKDTEIFVQGISKVEYLYVIRKGAVERYYNQGDRQILYEYLSEGDVFGGVSLLLHDGVSARMLTAKTDTDFFILPKKIFLDVCARHEAFSNYFTDIFGKLMLDRSFAALIAKGMQAKDEVVPHFFNQPVSSIHSRELNYCGADVSIQEAAVMMSRRRCSSIFVRGGNGEFIGIVTDNDLRRKVIGTAYDIKNPISDIMSSPLSAIPARASIFEALMSMMQKNLKHLAVTDASERVIGAVTVGDLIAAQGYSAFAIAREINAAVSIEEIANRREHLPHLVQNLIDGGVKADNVARLISTIADAILVKLIEFAVVELGPPPVRFVFLIFGSEGRREQTLKTDQDNAIMFEDVPMEFIDGVRGYFLKLGDRVCKWLDQVGYAFCKGEVMAKNPKWCQPISTWRDYFSSWIATVEPEALLQASIFFDYRGAYGDMELPAQLRRRLFASFAARPNFFRYLTENSLMVKPPLGFFGNFIVESKGEHRDSFDIKSSMTTIVNIARIYALKNGIEETNTLERLKQLYLKNVLSWRKYHELEQSYSFLMQLRFVRQIAAVMRENKSPDNYINPKTLSRLEQTMLREIFKSIEKFQAKMGADFSVSL